MCVTAILGAAAIGGAASLAAGGMQANAAQKASDTQAAAVDKSLALQERIYNENVDRQKPFLESGLAANKAYMNELGLGDEAKAGTFQSAFRETPGYQFQVQQGEQGVMNNLAALGMRGSGAGMKALTRFRQGLADQTYGNYLSRIGSAAGMGQAASSEANNMGQTYANNAGTLLGDSAAARTSGYVGGANAWSNALGSLSNTAGFALGLGSNNFGFGVPWQQKN